MDHTDAARYWYAYALDCEQCRCAPRDGSLPRRLLDYLRHLLTAFSHSRQRISTNSRSFSLRSFCYPQRKVRTRDTWVDR